MTDLSYTQVFGIYRAAEKKIGRRKKIILVENKSASL